MRNARFSNAVSGTATVALAPMLLAQGLRVRRTTPRLPGADGPVTGGDGGGLALLAIGESTVDGVGAPDHERALTGSVAAALAARTGRPVRWQALGRTGANARVVHAELLPRVARADLVVIALGVNDTTELRSGAAFRRDLLRLVTGVRRRLGPVPVVLAGVPPMGRFPALPQPLRAVLGLRSGVLASAAAELSAVPGVRYVPMPAAMLDPATFAADGFHPGPAAYRIWGDQLAGAALPLVTR
ncbi:SGNH/GDSL hydrolase family protein [Amycolatopsis minnesotensis]